MTCGEEGANEHVLNGVGWCAPPARHNRSTSCVDASLVREGSTPEKVARNRTHSIEREIGPIG